MLEILMDNLNIFLVIPWRETKTRKYIFQKLILWYKKNFPNINIILADSKHKVFNLSASRNIGIKQSFNSGADIVLVSDADFFSSKQNITLAIENTLSTERLSLPYTTYLELDIKGTSLFLENNHEYINSYKVKSHRPELINGNTNILWPCSGMNIFSKKVFNEVGPFDENYIGWGQEDIDYHKRYLDMYGTLFDYIDGLGISLDHKRDDWGGSHRDGDFPVATPIENPNAKYFIKKHGEGYII